MARLEVISGTWEPHRLIQVKINDTTRKRKIYVDHQRNKELYIIYKTVRYYQSDFERGHIMDNEQRIQAVINTLAGMTLTRRANMVIDGMEEEKDLLQFEGLDASQIEILCEELAEQAYFTPTILKEDRSRPSVGRSKENDKTLEEISLFLGLAREADRTENTKYYNMTARAFALADISKSLAIIADALTKLARDKKE